MKLGKLFKSFVNVCELPIEIVKDVASLGGVASGQNKTYTKQKIEEIEKNLDEVMK